MIINVGINELAVRVADGRVNVIHHSDSAHAKLAAEWREEAAQLRAEAGTSQATQNKGRRWRADQLELCAEALEENMTNVMLSLTPLAARNLAAVLPDHADEAARAYAAPPRMDIQRDIQRYGHSGHSLTECLRPVLNTPDERG